MTMRAVLIAGPTASGKSALAMALAARTGGAVVNADSMQVYRDLRIITARPTAEDERRAPHFLYGHMDAAENYSVGRWLTDAAAILDRLAAEGQIAIITGGTGLYFKALTQGLSAIPSVPADVRERVRGEARELATPALHARLAADDPRSGAALRTNDRQRILRAIEVLEATGRPLSEWQAQPGVPVLPLRDAAAVFLTVERDELHQRIDRRFQDMLAGGALQEVRKLQERRLDPSLPAMKAHGVPWLMRHLSGEISLEEAIAGGTADTRRYAKRQETWFRNQMKDWQWIEPERVEEYLISRLGA